MKQENNNINKSIPTPLPTTERQEERLWFGKLFHAIGSLLTGMKTTMTVFMRQKTTEQYPENRATLQISERFRGTLTMPHNERNEHHCVACGLCQMACPNDTIKVISEMVEGEDGKKKKTLVKYEYDLGSCIYCQLCVNACPHDAIRFTPEFEHAVFDRSKLVLTLNHGNLAPLATSSAGKKSKDTPNDNQNNI